MPTIRPLKCKTADALAWAYRHHVESMQSDLPMTEIDTFKWLLVTLEISFPEFLAAHGLSLDMFHSLRSRVGLQTQHNLAVFVKIEYKRQKQ